MAQQWILFTKRTGDPKLLWLECELRRRGIPCRRRGESFHAPILEVPAAKLDAAWAVLTSELDELPDDAPAFAAPPCPHCGTPRRWTNEYLPPTCGRSECQRAEHEACAARNRKPARSRRSP
jgi:hypothetical protein